MVKNCMQPRTQSAGNPKMPLTLILASQARGRHAALRKELYEGKAGLKRSDDVIAYCRIGERSSHTWFALTHLLGYPYVQNYDGSWTEWGNLVGVPIERNI
jgi:thiosulfate/3-mercaptopyruvate sulfurtransferase